MSNHKPIPILPGAPTSREGRWGPGHTEDIARALGLGPARSEERKTSVALYDQVLLDWLSRAMEDGCTDVRIYRMRDEWIVKMQHVGIPSSAPEARTIGHGPTLRLAVDGAHRLVEIVRAGLEVRDT